VAYLVPGVPGDAFLDWLTAHAILDGFDPHAPVPDIAAEYGWGVIDLAWPHPRLPGALLLGMVYAFPIGWLWLARAVCLGALVWTVRLVRPGWLAVPLVLFAAQAVWYGNASAVVTLLVAVALRGSPAALGAATVLRLWPWFIGLVWLVNGRWRDAVKAAGWFAGLNLAGLLLPGVTVEGTVAAFVEASRYAGTGVNWAVPLWVGVPFAVGFLFFARRFERWSPLAALAVSPVVWGHYLTVLVVPIGKTPRRSEGSGAASNPSRSRV